MLTAGLDIVTDDLSCGMGWASGTAGRSDFQRRRSHCQCPPLLEGHRYDHLVSTGYGRHRAIETGLAKA